MGRAPGLAAVSASVARVKPKANWGHEQWAARIQASWQHSVESILETGELLIAAKDALPHGEFEIMVQDQLPFGPRMVRQLMQIARHPVLANRQYIAVLPASWATLAELSRVDASALEGAVANHWLRADLGGKDVPKLLERIRRAFGERRSPKKAVPKRFFSEARRCFNRDAIRWLDGLKPSAQRLLIKKIVALIEQEMQ